MIELAICNYCRNKISDVCAECIEGGEFYYLEPMCLDIGEAPPKMPVMSKLLSLPAPTRLAFVVLALHYLQEGE